MSTQEDLIEEFRSIKLQAECARASISKARRDLSRLEFAFGSLVNKLGQIIDEPS